MTNEAEFTVDVDRVPRSWRSVVYVGLISIAVAIRSGLHEIAEAMKR